MILIEIRGMHSEELPSVHKMLERAFPNTHKSFFDQQVKSDPALRPEDTRLLLENEKIVSCIRVYFREMVCQGETIRIGGIGDVATDPHHQHCGHASSLMEDTIQYMRDNSAILSILFTRINAFYHTFGYMDLPTLHVQAEVPESPSGIRYRKVDLKKDLKKLRKLYSEFNRNKTGPVIRSALYWKKQMHFPRVDPDLFWLIENNEEIQCYVRGKVEGDCLKIQEWAYRPGKAHQAADLIGEMARITHKKKVDSRYLSDAETTLFDEWPARIVENRALMVRLIRLDQRSSFRTILRPHRFHFWESDRF
jgi:predicted acetyltransferase